jgi:hypothetical protein
MKFLKYSLLLLLLLSGIFLAGCYTSVASRGSGDRYPDQSAYGNENNNNNNDDSYTSQDTTYNNDDNDANVDDGPYPYYGRFYSSYYPSVAIGFGVGRYYDPFYWDPFFYDGWCAPYYFSYNPFFYYPYWGYAFGGGFHHGHGFYNSGFYRTRTGGGFALRNSGFRNNTYGVRGSLTRGAGIYSRNADRTRLVSSTGIATTRMALNKTNITRNTSVANPRSNAPDLRSRTNITTSRSHNPILRNRNNVNSRPNPYVRDNRGNRTYSNGNRPPQRPQQRYSSPGHSGNNSGRSNGSSTRGGNSGGSRGGNSGGSRSSGNSGGHSRR